MSITIITIVGMRGTTYDFFKSQLYEECSSPLKNVYYLCLYIYYVYYLYYNYLLYIQRYSDVKNIR